MSSSTHRNPLNSHSRLESNQREWLFEARAFAEWQLTCLYSGADEVASGVCNALRLVEQPCLLEGNYENRCLEEFCHCGNRCNSVDLSGVVGGSPGRALSQRATVQFSTEESLCPAKGSSRNRIKTVLNELRRVPRNCWTRNREHPGAIPRAYAVSARRRSLLVHHDWIR